MSTIEHARAELERAGFFDKDSDYDGMLGEAVMDLITVFSEQGHSGYSAMSVINIFSTLAKHKPLSPPTDDPAEWAVVGMGVNHEVSQNIRESECFSEDGGKTYYRLSEQRKWTRWPILGDIGFLRQRRLMYPIHTATQA